MTKAFYEGMKAHITRSHPHDYEKNPYPVFSKEWQEWNKGWDKSLVFSRKTN